MRTRESHDVWREVASTITFSLPACVPELVAVAPLGARVLEIGCGYGRVCKMLSDSGFVEVIGYDVSLAMIERGRQEAPHLSLKHYAGSSIPEPDCSVDAVVCCALLTSIPDGVARRRIVDECARLLRPKGVLHLIEFTRSDDRRYEENGTFQSGLGIRMIHLSVDELVRKLGCFETLVVKRFECASVSGRSEEAILYQGRKKG